VVSVDELGSGIANIRPQSLANLMKVRAPTAAQILNPKTLESCCHDSPWGRHLQGASCKAEVGPLACSPSSVICVRLWCTQVGSDGKTDPQELKDTLSRLPSKTLPDQQPPGQLVRNALLGRICHHATSPGLLHLSVLSG
jgi:hypothetical protein